MILVFTDPAIGGTFLTWTLHFLNGQTKTFNSKSGWTQLTRDPINNKSAHGFASNQLVVHSDFEEMQNILLKEPTSTFHSMYFHHLATDKHKPWTNCKDEITSNVIKSVSRNCEHAVYVKNKFPEYWCNSNHRGTDKEQKNYVDELWFQTYYPDNKILTNRNDYPIWDIREHIALGTHSTVEFEDMTSNFRPTVSFTIIDSMDLWTQFDCVVPLLFGKLQLDIDKNNWYHWINVYNKWKKIHIQRINFAKFYNNIVDAIINGNNVDLSYYDLDLFQEAYIQHTLIYKHDLNLRTWQLEKFTNTLDLHDRLEKNIHPLNTGI